MNARTTTPRKRRPKERLSIEKLPTNLSADWHPVHRWMNFIAGFSPEFVRRCIEEEGLAAGDRLLDPFAGLGTSLVEASSLGLSSIGYEPHPYLGDMAQAKIDPPTVNVLKKAVRAIAGTRPIDDVREMWSEDASTFLSKLVAPDELKRLGGAAQALTEQDESVRPIYRLIVSEMLEAASGSKTDGIYKAPTSNKRSVGFDVSLKRISDLIAEDLVALEGMSRGACELVRTSSEHMHQVASDSVDICVTSPPYLNNFDFAEMTRMELYFWGYASNWREITDRVRANLIVNTTTAPTSMKKAQDEWRELLTEDFLSSVDPLRDELREQRKTRAGHKEYDLLVYPYFAQVRRVLAEAHRVLKSESSLHLVVADAALYGVHIHTEELLAAIMDEIGFEVLDIVRLRDRGGRWVLAKRDGAKTPLGEFHVHARKR